MGHKKKFIFKQIVVFVSINIIIFLLISDFNYSSISSAVIKVSLSFAIFIYGMYLGYEFTNKLSNKYQNRVFIIKTLFYLILVVSIYLLRYFSSKKFGQDIIVQNFYLYPLLLMFFLNDLNNYYLKK